MPELLAARLRLEPPRVSRESAELGDQVAKAPGVVDGRLDLGAVANDAGVEHQPLDIAGAETRDG